jgi:predicted translin family RNA/ssDNA-binding protein
MTNAFSGALTGVEGLMDGFGGLRGMLVSTASIFGMKYAKEMPRILDDLKHNLNYTFSPKRYNADIQKRFDEATSGLDLLASRIDGKGFGDAVTVHAKEFKNNEGKVISRMDKYETK